MNLLQNLVSKHQNKFNFGYICTINMHYDLESKTKTCDHLNTNAKLKITKNVIFRNIGYTCNAFFPNIWY